MLNLNVQDTLDITNKHFTTNMPIITENLSYQ